MSVKITGGDLNFTATLDDSDIERGVVNIETSFNRATGTVVAATAAQRDVIRRLTGDIQKYTDALADPGNSDPLHQKQLQESLQLSQDALTKLTGITLESTAALADVGATGGEALKQTAQQAANVQSEIKRVTLDIQNYKAGLADESNADPLSQRRLQESLDLSIARLEKLTGSAKQADAALSKLGTNGAESLVKLDAGAERAAGLIEELKIKLESLNIQKTQATSEGALGPINKQIVETQTEITRLGNVGKTGYDEFGNAVVEAEKKQNKFGSALSRVTDLGNIGATVVSRLSRQIIGLGVGMLSFYIGAKAIEVLIGFFGQLIAYGDRFDVLRKKLDDFNEVNANAVKSIGDQASNLQILYRAATDVNNSMADRIKFANEIKEQYPNSFANSTTQAILNGQEADSYKELSRQIVAQAQAKAVADKIAANGIVIANANIEKQKIDNAHFNEVQKAKKNGPAISSGEAADAVINTDISVADLIKASNERAAFATKEQNSIIAIAEQANSFLTNFAGGTARVANALNKNNNLIKEPLKNFDTIIKNASQEADLVNLKAALEAKLKALAPNDAQIKVLAGKIRQVDELLKQYNPKPNDGKAAANADAESLKRRIALLNEVGNAVNAVNRSTLSADVQALVTIEDKYDQLRKKIQAFNADPKNKNHKIGSQVIAGLNASEATAVNDQSNVNENEYIAKDIEAKKKLYADYEAYRAKVGDGIADKEYSDLLRSGKDFQTYLENQQKAISSDDSSSPIQARRDLVKKALIDNLEAQKKSFQQLLIETASYTDKREALIAVNEDQIKLLNAAGYTEQAAALKIALEDQLTALDVSAFETIGRYKTLFSKIETLSTDYSKKMIKAALAEASAKYGEGGELEDKEAYDKIVADIKKLDQSVSDRLPNKIIEVSSALKTIGSVIAPSNAGLGQLLNGLGDIGAGVANIYKLADAFKDAVGAEAKFAAGVGLVTGAISLISSAETTIAGFFDSSIEAQKKSAEQQKYNQEQQQKANEAITKQLSEQLAIIKDIYGTARLTSYSTSLTAISKAQSDQAAKLKGKLALTGNKEFDDYITKVNNGTPTSFIDDAKYKFLLEQMKQIGAVTDLSTQSLDQLQKLLDSGSIDSGTASIVQSLIDLKQQYQDTLNALNEESVGTSFESLLDNIVQMFNNVNTTAQDWADNFTNIVQGAISKSFERQFLETQLQAFYDELAADVKANGGGALTASQIKALQDEYNQDIANAQAGIAGIEAITGQKFGTAGSSTSGTGLSGAIKGITADQADLLAGQFGGLRQSSLATNGLITQTNLTLGQLAAMGGQNLAMLTQIEINTRSTAGNTGASLPILQSLDSGIALLIKTVKAGSGTLTANGLKP